MGIKYKEFLSNFVESLKKDLEKINRLECHANLLSGIIKKSHKDYENCINDIKKYYNTSKTNSILLKENDEKFLLYTIFNIKTVLFYSLLLNEKIYNDFLEKLNKYIKSLKEGQIDKELYNYFEEKYFEILIMELNIENFTEETKDNIDIDSIEQINETDLEEIESEEIEDENEGSIEEIEDNIKEEFQIFNEATHNKLKNQRIKVNKNHKKIPIEKKIITLEEIKTNIIKIRNKLLKNNLDNSILIEMINSIHKISPTNLFFKENIKILEKEIINQNEKILTKEDLNKIKFLFTTYKKIKDILVLFNQGLTINLTRKYMQQVAGENNSFSFYDIQASSIIGLIKVIEKFNPYVFKNYKLSTYATWWIKQRVISTINKYRNPIEIPLYYTKMMNIIHQVIEILKEKNKLVTAKNIYKELNENPYFKNKVNIKEISIKRIETTLELLNYSTIEINSKDEQNNEDNENNLFDYLTYKDYKENDIEKIIDYEMLKKEVRKIFQENILNNKEKYILMNRLSFLTEEPKTLDELGKKINRTKERVRQLEKSGMEKLIKELKKRFNKN